VRSLELRFEQAGRENGPPSPGAVSLSFQVDADGRPASSLRPPGPKVFFHRALQPGVVRMSEWPIISSTRTADTLFAAAPGDRLVVQSFTGSASGLLRRIQPRCEDPLQLGTTEPRQPPFGRSEPSTWPRRNLRLRAGPALVPIGPRDTQLRPGASSGGGVPLHFQAHQRPNRPCDLLHRRRWCGLVRASPHPRAPSASFPGCTDVHPPSNPRAAALRERDAQGSPDDGRS
jgi:hypothetical protein